MGDPQVMKAMSELRELFRVQPYVQAPRQLLTHLRDKLDHNFTQGEIAKALERMSQCGEVDLSRIGGVEDGIWNGVKYLQRERKRSRQKDEPPSWEPTRSSEQGVANEVPAFLSDDHCSPVEIRRGRWPVHPIDDQKTITSGNLTSALNALRNNSDQDGVLQTDSGVRAIEWAMDCTHTQASHLYQRLAVLGLRKSVNRGNGVWETVVEMVLEAVTDELLQESAAARKSIPMFIRQQEEAAEKAPSDPVSEDPHVPAPTGEAVITPEIALERMADIISSLEQQIAERDQKAADQEREMGLLTVQESYFRSECLRLEGLAASLVQENRELKAAQAQPVINGRYAAILDRYAASS